ncbi:MarR family transcriptional regulator [Modestobacter roseus]|uniref:MarR family transcriptional regulator n=1 Tax=Modestobacter roseus TaxID=1181884 RepID=UPI0034DE85B9
MSPDDTAPSPDDTTPWPDDAAGCADSPTWAALSAEARAVAQLGAEIGLYSVRRRLGPLLAVPLTVQQLRCLTVLVVEGAATPHQLSELLAVTPATTTGIVDRLVRAGMADRAQDTRDGRGRVLTPTRTGVQVVRELLATDVETDARVLGGLTRDELAGLQHGLSGVLRELRALGRDDDAPAHPAG